MPAFNKERPETNKSYSPPEGTPLDRKAVPIASKDLTPSLREALGFTVMEAKLFQVEVRGGVWTHYSQVDADRTDYDGDYDTRAPREQEGRLYGTLYGVYLNDKVHIVNQEPPTNPKLLDKSSLSMGMSIISSLELLERPYGIGAEVVLEPVEGTDLTIPVLKYVEVVPQRVKLPTPSITPKEVLREIKIPLRLTYNPRSNLNSIFPKRII